MQFKVPAQTSAIITNGEQMTVLGCQPADMATAYLASRIAIYRLHFHSTSPLHFILDALLTPGSKGHGAAYLQMLYS